MQRISFSFFSLIFLLLLAFSACKHQEKISNRPLATEGISIQTLLDSIDMSCGNFRKIAYKGQGEMDVAGDKNDVSFTYRLRLAHDSLIWCSVTKFSIEFMQGLVSRDSMKMHSMMPESVRICDLDWLSKKIGFQPDLTMMEGVLMGRPWLQGDSAKILNGTKTPFLFQNKVGSYQYTGYIEPQPMRLVMAELESPSMKGKTKITYSDFRTTSAGLIPHRIEFTIDNPDTGLSTFTLSHSTVTVNGENTNFEFHIPNGATIKHCDEK